MLSNEHWLEVIERAPLIAIDLVMRNAQGEVLLGLRSNRPARDTWFVPGGVVRKNETLDQAFSRIAQTEIALHLRRENSRFMGTYEHFYDDNFHNAPGVSTHYIVLAYEIIAEQLSEFGPLEQHRQLKLFSIDDALRNDQVHKNTKAYFQR